MSATPQPPPQTTAPGVHPKRWWSLRPASDREAGDAVVSNFLLHWFPAKSYKPSLSWSYSFWLGTVSAALLFLLILSGLPLLFLYIPSVERAYASVKDIEYVITFGSWIRAVHRISAHLMVAAVFLHLVRVFLTGAYKNGVGQNQKRQWNWVLGVGMLLLTLFLSFTGYLLPWDQLAYWAVTVGTNIASSVPLVGPAARELLIGGRSIEQPTLIRFYVLHVLFLPMLIGVLFVYHMWRVRKDGGLAKADTARLAGEKAELPASKSKTYTLLGIARGTAPQVRASTLEAQGMTVNSVPDLTRRIAIVILGTIALVGILSVFVRSPLEEPANPLITPNPAKAPWYFLWLQEIVTDTTVHIGSFTINGAFLGGVLLPGALLALLTAWPWLDRSPGGAAGAWFAASRRRQNIVFLLLVAGVLALTVIGTFLRGPYWHFYWPEAMARAAVEDLTWNREPDSPYPKKDRPVLAIIGVLLVVSTVLFAWSDRKHDWRYYQYAFRGQVTEKLGAEKAKTIPSGVQQIWVSEMRRADRCITCHQAILWKGFEKAENPFKTHPVEPLKGHPIEKYGCTSCHGGQGWAIDAAAAHGPVEHWEEPLLGSQLGEAYTLAANKTALMQMNCNVCHRFDRETKGADEINLAKKLVLDKGCRACHVINSRGGTIGPDLTWVGDKAPEQYEYGRLSGQMSAYAWHVAHFKDPRALVPETVMPNFHLTTREAQALAMLALSWRRAPIPADYRPGLPRTDPQTPEEIAEEQRMKTGPGAWFVKTGCFVCHSIQALGVKSPAQIGPDLSTAVEDTQARFGRTVDDFLRSPTGTMAVVLSRQIILTPQQKEVAVQKLREAFSEYQKQKAQGQKTPADQAGGH